MGGEITPEKCGTRGAEILEKRFDVLMRRRDEGCGAGVVVAAADPVLGGAELAGVLLEARSREQGWWMEITFPITSGSRRRLSRAATASATAAVWSRLLTVAMACASPPRREAS